MVLTFCYLHSTSCSFLFNFFASPPLDLIPLDYENIGYSKPNPAYYQHILTRLGAQAEDCLMVGNDVDEDMGAAQQAGLSVFLLTDCLINREGKDITPYPQGDFDALMGFVQSWA